MYTNSDALNKLKLLNIILFLVLCSASVNAKEKPWRLENVLNVPSWLSITGSHRTRYETLNNQYRSGGNGGDQALLMRTMLLANINFKRFEIALEIMDSRAELIDSGTDAKTVLVNPIDLLQAYVLWNGENLFYDGWSTNIKVGRFTMDVGSRRLIARNRFRNTINSFTGLDWHWANSTGQQIRSFYVLPVNRLPNPPSGFDRVLENDINFDEESTRNRLWGIYFSTKSFSDSDLAEIYVYGLNEGDRKNFPSRNRKLYTTGFRLLRHASKGGFDYELETAFQIGKSRSNTAATNTRNLDHCAQFVHAEVGYTFDTLWSPQLVLQYDYGTGDRNPNDRKNERFDGLFGGRRFDFGPTSIYGPISRSNSNTPGIRLRVKPAQNIKAFVSYRGFWLAEQRDAWPVARIRDSNANSGGFIGHQIELRLRWDIFPKNIRLEAGAAHLFAGEFIKNASNSPGQGDSSYIYSQVHLFF